MIAADLLCHPPSKFKTAKARLEGLKPGGYVVAADAAPVTLAGNTLRGALYAVYGFIKTQSCGREWHLGIRVSRREIQEHHSRRVQDPGADNQLL